MDGLTNIIAKIHEENDAQCEKMLSAANSRAEQILSDAKKQACAVAEKIKADTEEKLSVINAKAVSGADLEYKRAILKHKSNLMNKAIENALADINNSPDEVYFGYVEKLVLANALAGKGNLIMSKKDVLRMPSDFSEKINKALEDGKSISVSNETLECFGGFVIEYPEMRVDCTFASLVEEKLDDIRDKLNRELFA